jgi:hypothetical protein
VQIQSMNHAQKYLAQANRHIAELAVQIARQRVIVKHALNTGQRSEMAESLLDALEGSLRLFEKHRIFLLSCSGSRSWKRRRAPLAAPTIKSTHQPAKGASAALRVPFSPACEPTFSLLKEGRQPVRERVIG